MSLQMRFQPEGGHIVIAVNALHDFLRRLGTFSTGRVSVSKAKPFSSQSESKMTNMVNEILDLQIPQLS